MTDPLFSRNAKRLHEHVHPKVRRPPPRVAPAPARVLHPVALLCLRAQTGTPAPLIADDVMAIIDKHAARIDAAMHYERDFE